MVIPHCQDRPFSCEECPGCSQSLWAFSCASCALFPVEMWVFGQGSWGAARDGMQAEFLQGGWCCLGNPGWLWSRIQGRVSAPLTFLSENLTELLVAALAAWGWSQRFKFPREFLALFYTPVEMGMIPWAPSLAEMGMVVPVPASLLF